MNDLDLRPHWLVEFWMHSTNRFVTYGPFATERQLNEHFAARAAEVIAHVDLDALNDVRVGKFRATSEDDAISQARDLGMDDPNVEVPFP